MNNDSDRTTLWVNCSEWIDYRGSRCDSYWTHSRCSQIRLVVVDIDGDSEAVITVKLIETYAIVRFHQACESACGYVVSRTHGYFKIRSEGDPSRAVTTFQVQSGIRISICDGRCEDLGASN